MGEGASCVFYLLFSRCDTLVYIESIVLVAILMLHPQPEARPPTA